ncbi:hypothetical protein AVEN_187866-1 [Araneus ventricosus]|uniref:Uncharacterized protein n=1 Tax=Araneus ventricosus TaxID=182803 RepID=A0A4Y2CTS7_ARAVE|nr:hypothetical protein AVEN_187866-1 [Araneus ventricosus]
MCSLFAFLNRPYQLFTICIERIIIAALKILLVRPFFQLPKFSQAFQCKKVPHPWPILCLTCQRLPNESDCSSQNKEAIESSNFYIVLSFLRCETSTAPQQIHDNCTNQATTIKIRLDFCKEKAD